MSFNKHSLLGIPEETRRVAELVCVGSTAWYMTFSRDVRRLYDTIDFESLYPDAGQWGVHPFRVFAFVLLQVLEGCSDRGAVDQLSVNIGWKYVLGLTLDDPGWKMSVLVNARDRLLSVDPEKFVLTKQLEMFREKKVLDVTKQRLDATFIHARVSLLNRTELLLETVRTSIECLSTEAPKFLGAIKKADWQKRYFLNRPWNYRLPQSDKDRTRIAQEAGEDGFYILACIRKAEPDLRLHLEELEPIKVLGKILSDQFHGPSGKSKPKLRDHSELKPSAERIVSPHETDARTAVKGKESCTGYKCHITETCVSGFPNLITDARIEPATTNDSLSLPTIVDSLNERNLLPSKLYCDSGYVNASYLTQVFHELKLKVFTILLNGHSWQSKESKGFDIGQFQVDFEKEKVICPAGTASSKWKKKRDGHIDVYFEKEACGACPFKENCTKAEQRIIRVQPKAVFEYQQLMRREQETKDFKKEYSIRSGVEGTHSEIVRIGGRQSSYRGKAKTNLKYTLVAVCLNFARYFRWQTRADSRTKTDGKILALAVA